MDTDLLREAAQVSFYANAEACLICVVGAAAVHFRLVDQAFLKTLSRMLLRLFFPCLAFGALRPAPPRDPSAPARARAAPPREPLNAPPIPPLLTT